MVVDELEEALEAHYAQHPGCRPTLAEVALALAAQDGSPLAGRPDLIEAAAEAALAQLPGADADDVLAWAARAAFERPETGPEQLAAEALVQLEELAPWSDWVAFAEALTVAPRLPGVYMARSRQSRELVYVGMAGERRGNGLRGRLSVYCSGKALASGLGEAVFDRALADEEWLRARLADVEAGTPARAKEWGRLAFQRADLELRWAVTADRASASTLERAALAALHASALWNRLR